MREYFKLLLTTGIIGSIASVLSDGSSLGKYVKYISALVCVIIVIAPLSSIFKGFSPPKKQIDETELSGEGPIDFATKLTENQICEKIHEKFGILPKEVSIKIDTDGKVNIDFSLNEDDMWAYDRVDEFIDSLCK